MTYGKDQMRAWTKVPMIWNDWRAYMENPHEGMWPGVYCFWSKACLVYVGYSINVYKRIRQHRLRHFMPYPTHITALRCETTQQAATIEGDLIRAHRPKCNKRIEPKGGHVRAGARAA